MKASTFLLIAFLITTKVRSVWVVCLRIISIVVRLGVVMIVLIDIMETVQLLITLITNSQCLGGLQT